MIQETLGECVNQTIQLPDGDIRIAYDRHGIRSIHRPFRSHLSEDMRRMLHEILVDPEGASGRAVLVEFLPGFPCWQV